MEEGGVPIRLARTDVARLAFPGAISDPRRDPACAMLPMCACCIGVEFCVWLWGGNADIDEEVDP